MSVLFNESENINFRHNDYPSLHTVKDALVQALEGGGGGGTSDYEDLDNLPTINGVDVKGDLTSVDLKLSETVVVPTGEPMTLTGLQDMFLNDESIKMAYIPVLTFTFGESDKLSWGGIDITTGEGGNKIFAGTAGACDSLYRQNTALFALEFTLEKLVDGNDTYYPEIRFIGCTCYIDDSENDNYIYKRIRIKAQSITVITRKNVLGSQKNLAKISICDQYLGWNKTGEDALPQNIGDGFIPFTFVSTPSDTINYDVSLTYRITKADESVTRSMSPSSYTKSDQNIKKYLQNDPRILCNCLPSGRRDEYKYLGLIVADIDENNLWSLTSATPHYSSLTLSMEKFSFSGPIVIYR